MRHLAAAWATASLLVALVGSGGTAYDCRVDGERHARCCCEQDAGCAQPSQANAVPQQCGCCTVVRLEPLELGPTVVSRIGIIAQGSAAALLLSHPTDAQLELHGPPPRIAPGVGNRPSGTRVFLEHRKLRL